MRLWIPVNMVLGKMWNSRFKMMRKMNREQKYNLRDVEGSVKYL